MCLRIQRSLGIEQAKRRVDVLTARLAATLVASLFSRKSFQNFTTAKAFSH